MYNVLQFIFFLLKVARVERPTPRQQLQMTVALCGKTVVLVQRSDTPPAKPKRELLIGQQGTGPVPITEL